MELMRLTMMDGDIVFVNKDKVMYVGQHLEYRGIAEEPQMLTRVALENDIDFYTAEDIHSVVGRFNKNEIEEAVDRLLAHDSNGMVVRVRQ